MKAIQKEFIFPAASRGEPSSRRAEVEITSSGQRRGMAEVAFALLRSHPGRTACELEELAGLRNGQIRKRLNDLLSAGRAKQGVARRCAVTGKTAREWWPRY